MRVFWVCDRSLPPLLSPPGGRRGREGGGKSQNTPTCGETHLKCVFFGFVTDLSLHLPPLRGGRKWRERAGNRLDFSLFLSLSLPLVPSPSPSTSLSLYRSLSLSLSVFLSFHLSLSVSLSLYLSLSVSFFLPFYFSPSLSLFPLSLFPGRT